MDVLFYAIVAAVYGGVGLWCAQSRWDKWDEGNLKDGDDSWRSLPEFPISNLHGDVGKPEARNLETMFFSPLIRARASGDKTEDELRRIERDCRMSYSFAMAFIWPLIVGFGLALLPFTVPLKIMELLKEPKRRARRKRFLKAAEWEETPAAEVEQLTKEHQQLGGRVSRLEAIVEVDSILKEQVPPKPASVGDNINSSLLAFSAGEHNDK